MSPSTQTRPDFSIVIINYNYARFLPDSIGSALAQDHPSFEIVVVDDASTDESKRVIESYGDKVLPVLKAANRGHGDGFNQGFAASRGEIVLFLDADDYLHPHALSTIARHRGDDVALYQWRMDLVSDDRRRLDSYPAPEIAMDDGDVSQKLLQTGRFSTTVTSGLAFVREALEKILPMDAEAFRQGGDGYLVTVAPLYGSVKTVPGTLGAYRMHGSNHSQFDAALAKRARWRMEHDDERIAALQSHARALGLTCAQDPGFEDLTHLTERIASLRMDRTQHPYAADTPSAVATQGLRLTLRSAMGPGRKLVLGAWWIAAGHAPDRLAQNLIAWRLYAPSRPAWVDRNAKRLRSLLGKGEKTKAGA